MIILVPILAIILFIQSLWALSLSSLPKSFNSGSSSSVIENSVSDHVAIHGNEALESKESARVALFRSLAPQDHWVSAADNNSASKLSQSLDDWRNMFIIQNDADKNQDLTKIGSPTAIPPAHGRAPIYTYFGLTDTNSKIYRSELAMLETWKRTWYAMGFRPVVLTAVDALKHPEYSSFIRALDSSGKASEWTKSHFSQFLAWSTVGGVLCDYRVFPMTRFFNDDILLMLRQAKYSGPPLSFVQEDSALVAADDISAKNIVADLVLSSSHSADPEKLQEVLKKAFKQYKDTNEVFAYYSDKNMNLISFGLFGENYGDKAYDPEYVLLAIRVHLHQIFMNAYPDGAVYVDPVTLTFTDQSLTSKQRDQKKKQYKKDILTMTPDRFNFVMPVINEDGSPNYDALDTLALPARKIASDLNKCPPAKYNGFANLCRPTYSTIEKIESLVSGNDVKSTSLKDIKSTDVCFSLPCSAPFTQSLNTLSKNKKDYSYAYLNQPAKNVGHLPNPAVDHSFAISIISHPMTLLYMCMRDPKAIPFLDYVRFFFSRDGITNVLSANVFKDTPYVSSLYKVKYLKEAMYKLPAQSNVTWIPLEADMNSVGKLIEWEIGFTPLRNVPKTGKIEFSADLPDWVAKLGGDFKIKNAKSTSKNSFADSVENGWEGYTQPIEQTKSELGKRLEMVEGFVERHVTNLLEGFKSPSKIKSIFGNAGNGKKKKISATVRPIPGQEGTPVEERLALIDAMYKWSPADGEIWTFLKLWTKQRFDSLKRSSEGQFGEAI